MLLPRIHRAVRTSLWLVPLCCVLAAIGLTLGTLAADRASGYRLVPQTVTGTPSSVQEILGPLASATASLTSLVLTVTLVAIQLAMGQFSPRIVSALLTDRFNQLAVGLFGATFVVAVLTLREVDISAGTVPGLSVLVVYAFMFASMVMLVVFVHHAGRALRVSGLVDLVGDETRTLIVRTVPGGIPVGIADPDTIVTLSPGTLLYVDRPRLVALARRADCVLELVPVVGDFLVGGAPLFRVHPAPGAPDDDRPGRRLDSAQVTRLVLLGSERVHGEDLSYGFRKLTDVAERAVATTFDDPSTAVQALHRLHDLLRQLAPYPLASGEHRDCDGVLRLVERVLTWDGYVRLAFDEIRLAGASAPPVSRRMVAALLDLKSVAPAHRQAPLDRQLRLLTAAVNRTYADEEDRTAALTPDVEGIGSGPDVTTPVRPELFGIPALTTAPVRPRVRMP